MIGLLSPACYTDPSILELERKHLFGDMWVFAGLKHEVATSDKFFTREVAGYQVVVQNFEGTVRAFENVCLHRGKLIQTEPCGRRPLVCGYHGWRYGADGRVQTIPFEAGCYRLDAEERAGLRLREFAVRVVGALIFVNVAEQPIPFESQFSQPLQAALESVSRAFDDDFLVTRWKRQFNWKLAYENLRDMVHPRFVHTKSLNLYAEFPMTMEASISQDPRSDSEGTLELSELSFGGAEGQLTRSRPPKFAEWVDRWGTTDAYFNWLLYPNTHILTSDGGYSFMIEHHHPVSPVTTEVAIYVMTARKLHRSAWLAPTLWEIAKGAKVVLDEDTRVMEDVQRAICPGSRRIVQGVSEMQNRRTDRWYSKNVLRHLPKTTP